VSSHPSISLKLSMKERNGIFSPNGQWLAFTSNRSGQFEVYVRP